MPKRLQEIQLPPGFVDGTPRMIKQRWWRGNHVRFRDGRLRPIGGWQEFPLSRHSETLDSAVRGHHQWRDNSGIGFMAFGTAGSGSPDYGKLFAFQMQTPGTFTDATADTTDATADITVDDGTDYEVGDLISGSGIPAGATITAVSTNTITISANATATATNITVTVTPTTSRQRLVEITPSGYQATGDSEFRPQYSSYYYGGDFPYGYSYSGSGSASYSRTAHWSLDNFGANLIGVQSGDTGIFYWQGDVGTAGGSPTLAEEITTANGYTETAPAAIAVLVTQERHVLALGAAGDLRQIKWSNQETVDEWTPSATNTAGDLILQTTGYIVCGKRVQGGVLIWTETDLHQLTYLGPPLVYGVQKLADNAGVFSPYAIHSSSEITIWLNRGGFWIYDGYARPVQNCPIQDRVMRTVDWSQEGLIYSGGNSEFGEVWWWCPSKSGASGECGYYVIYNYRDNVWYDSLASSGITRNAWVDKNVWNSPIAIDPSDNTIYTHENTDPAQTTAANAETGAIDMMGGERFTRISKIFSDSDQDSAGSINYQFYTSVSADADETESTTYPLEADGEIDLRLQGRQVRYKVSGELADDWTVGNTRFETHVGGRR
jgi:hypothetical protein